MRNVRSIFFLASQIHFPIFAFYFLLSLISIRVVVRKEHLVGEWRRGQFKSHVFVWKCISTFSGSLTSIMAKDVERFQLMESNYFQLKHAFIDWNAFEPTSFESDRIYFNPSQIEFYSIESRFTENEKKSLKKIIYFFVVKFNFDVRICQIQTWDWARDKISIFLHWMEIDKCNWRLQFVWFQWIFCVFDDREC